MSEYNTFRVEDNQVIHTRLLNAPRELVWEVWTNPEHMKEWWGPEGFTITTRSMTVQPGQTWDFVMHGFGRDYMNNVQYLEVVKPSFLSFRNGEEQDDYSFIVQVTLEEKEDKTLLTMRSIFKSASIIEELNRKVNALEGGKQTLNKLQRYVEQKASIHL